jgi:hypothetical protein
VGFESGEPGVSEAKLITLFCSLAKFTASEMLYIEGWVLSKPHGNLPAFIELVLQLFLDWFTFSTWKHFVSSASCNHSQDLMEPGRSTIRIAKSAVVGSLD